ncbi:hypothetical protein B0H11DRAFT_1933461 [Mycena galericulata]|nr:hypothetical protein B0H11DRAFT_1933461 [Mycena galericulata]
MPFPFDPTPDASKMTKDEIKAYNARVASWVYNDKNRDTRNEKKRLRMASNREVLVRRERKRRIKERRQPEYPEKLRQRREKRRKPTRQVASESEKLPNLNVSPPPVDLYLESLVEYSRYTTMLTADKIQERLRSLQRLRTVRRAQLVHCRGIREYEQARDVLRRIDVQIRQVAQLHISAETIENIWAEVNPNPFVARAMGAGPCQSLEELMRGDDEQARLWARLCAHEIAEQSPISDYLTSTQALLAEREDPRSGRREGGEEVDYMPLNYGLLLNFSLNWAGVLNAPSASGRQTSTLAMRDNDGIAK